jgi:hypothetical protein
LCPVRTAWLREHDLTEPEVPNDVRHLTNQVFDLVGGIPRERAGYPDQTPPPVAEKRSDRIKREMAVWRRQHPGRDFGREL